MSALAAISARGIGVGTVIISVPLTLSYLGAERYGMWMTMSSIVALLGFADLGIGYGLLNLIAQADAEGDRIKAQRYVSTAFAIFALVAVFLGVCLVLLYPFVPWPGLFNVTSKTAVSEAGPSIAAFTSCFLVGLVLGVATAIRAGHQEGYFNSISAAIGNVLGLVFVLLAIALRQGLPVLVLALAGAPLLATSANLALIVRRHRPWLRFDRHSVDRDVAAVLLRTGLLFLVLQVSLTVGNASDSLVVAQIVGPSAVASYNVAFRLFSIVTLLTSVWLVPLWPAYREATARGDVAWVRRTLRRSIRLSLIVTIPVAALLVLLGQRAIGFWVGASVQVPSSLLLGFGCWAVLAAFGNAASMYLNGAQIIWFQVLTATTTAAANIVLSVYLTYRFGVAGVVWGTVIASVLFSTIPLYIFVRRALRPLDNQGGS